MTDTLVDKWIARAKNNPVIACLIFLALTITGFASFTGSIDTFKRIFTGEPQKAIVVQVSQAQAPSPPAKRVNFREDFELGERDIFISEHGVTVKSNEIMILEGRGTVAQIGASANNQIEFLEMHKKGDQINLQRHDCDSLTVLIKNIQVNLPVGIPPK